MFGLSLLVLPLGCKERAPEVVSADRVWYGQQKQDEAGRELDVSVLDDAGFASVLVGTPSSSENPEAHSGGAYLLDRDTPGGVLDEVAIATFTGDRSNAFGRDVAIVGDLTGDGRSDLVVVGNDEREGQETILHVHAGPVSGTLSADDAFMTLSYDGHTESPAWMTRCGDLNGDKVEDLCIGATAGIEGTTSKAAILYGPVPSGIVPFAEVSVLVTGTGCAGQHIEGGSDLDGDGALDLIVGDGCRNGYEGGLYRVSQPGTGEASLEDFPTWTGEPGTGEAGAGLAVGGDLDGDGLPDLFVGAPQWNERAGRGYVVVDKDGGPLADAHASIDADKQDWTGFDAAIGDLDGDGAADLAVGAPRDIYFGFDRPGQVAVFLGPIAAGPTTFDDADLRFGGSSEPDAFGVSLDAGDVDGDGRDDLVVGAQLDSTEAPTSGAVYLFGGRTLFP